MMVALDENERRAMALIEWAAAGERACPSNHDFAERADCDPKTAINVLARLQRKGLIRIEGSGSRRRITVIATGQRTGVTVGARRIIHDYEDRLSRNPAAVLDVHEPCGWCGSRVDACQCKTGRAARRWGVAA